MVTESKLKTVTKILQAAIIVLLCAVSVSPNIAFAQATTTPTVTAPDPAKTSYDPAVNPLLKGYRFAKIDKGVPQEDSSRDGSMCRFYAKEDSPANALEKKGCIVTDGRFAFCGSDTILTGPTGASGGTWGGDCIMSDGTTVAGEVTTAGEQAADTIKEFGGSALTVALNAVAFFVLGIASFLLGIIGSAFNWVVINTIFDFGAIFGTSESMIIAWGVLRDVGNIVLLFGFILMGVLTILNLHDYPVKKTIPGLIIFAVLLNFSLFASQVVIDVSNAFSSIFYEQASAEPCPAGTAVKECVKNDNAGISGIIVERAGLTSAYGISDAKAEAMNPATRGIVFLGLALFLTVAAIVLLAATIMLVIRAVMLSFLMVVSPIGFAGMAIPPLKGLAKKWWQQLLKQAFYAPVFLLLIFVSLKLTEGLSAGVTDPEHGLANALAGGSFGGMGIIVTFMVVIGFMIASLLAAKELGAMGASFASNAAGAMVLGGMARATNATIGGAAFGARLGLQRVAPNSRVAQVITNRALRPMERANMDPRRLPGAGALLGTMGIQAGAKPSEHTSFADMRHQYDDFKSGKKGRELQAQFESEVNNQRLEREAHNGSISPEMQQYLQTLSAKELESLHGIKEGIDTLAQHLSPEQFENLMKSDQLTGAEKGKLQSGRFKPLTDAVKSGGNVKDLVGKMSKKDLERLPPALLNSQSVLDSLSEKQREDLSSSATRTADERSKIKGSSKYGKLNTAFGANANAAAVLALGGLDGLNAAEVSKLDTKVLLHPDISRQLTPAMLKKLADENKLTGAEMTTIGNNLRAPGGGVKPQTANYLQTPAGMIW